MRQQGQQAESWFKAHGGRSLNNPDATLYQMGAPWIDPPDGFQEFYFPGIIATPAQGAGDTTAIQFTVPNGWNGVIKRISTWYSANFQNGSGQIIWRLLRNGRPFKNFDNVLVLLGTPGAPFDFGRGGLQLTAGDTITGIVNNVSAVAPGTQVAWYVGGYNYPEQS